MTPAIQIFKGYQYWMLMIITVLFLNGCCKAVITYETYYNNNTQQIIELKFYENGFDKTLVLDKYSINRTSFHFFTEDSILVYINDTLNAIHYPENSLNQVVNPKVIKPSDPGSLFDSHNYTSEKVNLKCDGSITKSIYVFEN